MPEFYASAYNKPMASMKTREGIKYYNLKNNNIKLINSKVDKNVFNSKLPHFYYLQAG